MEGKIVVCAPPSTVSARASLEREVVSPHDGRIGAGRYPGGGKETKMWLCDFINSQEPAVKPFHKTKFPFFASCVADHMS